MAPDPVRQPELPVPRDGERGYEPIGPRGPDWRGPLRRVGGGIVILLGLAAKLGSLAKFAALFVAFGGYALIWGWRFALGVILLLFAHEMGHFLEATRERLNPSWPVFIPFLGAYVKHTRGNPWQTAKVALAGPDPRRPRRPRLLPRRPEQRLAAAPRARLLRLPAEPDQPAAVRDPRRRLDLALDPLPLARGRAREGDRLGRAVRRNGDPAGDRRVRRVRAAAPALASALSARGCRPCRRARPTGRRARCTSRPDRRRTCRGRARPIARPASRRGRAP